MPPCTLKHPDPTVTSPLQTTEAGEKISGTAFEKAAGMGGAKKWKESVKVLSGRFAGKQVLALAVCANRSLM